MKKDFAQAPKNTFGFTLIELLVVIAIIGILSSVVLASLNTARTKGRDGAIKANLNTIRSEIELYYLGSNSYGVPAEASEGVCEATGQPFEDILNIRNAIASAESSSGEEAVCAVGPNGSSWAVSVPLASNSSTSWCVNDIGAGGLGTASGGDSDPATCENN